MISTIFKSSLFRSSSIYTIANILNSAIPFLMLPILTRYLTPVDYGIVSMFLVLVNFLMPLVGINIQGAISRQYFEKEEVNISQYIANALIVLFLNALIITIIISLFSREISELTHFPSKGLWMVVLVAVCQVIVQINLVIWQAQVKPFQYSVFQILQSIFNVLMTIYLVVKLGFGWEGRVQGQAIVVGLFSLISLFILWRNKWIKLNFNKRYIKHLFLFGGPLIPHAIGASIITMIDRLFITNMVGISATGVYTVGYQIGLIIGILQDSFNKAWVPWFYERLKNGDSNERRKIVKITYFYFVVIILLALVLSVISPWILKFFVGKEFLNANRYVLWIALGYAFNGMYKMVVNYIFFVQKTYILTLLTFLTAILNIIFNYFLISINGAVGAAQATTLSFFIVFVLTWFISNKVYHMPWIRRKG
jgi:O-antigen/teichoic acid export membrane protein